MKFDIRSRLEFFLAKVAGKDIDIATLVPPVASTTTEELLLAIADRLDSAEDAAGAASTTTEELLLAITDRLDSVEDAAGAAPAAATTAEAGVVKMAANVAEAAGEAPTDAEFKALIDALIAAGIMAAPAAQDGDGEG